MRNRTGPSDAELLGEERDRRMSAEAAIARVRELCENKSQFLPGNCTGTMKPIHLVSVPEVLRALDGGTE